MKNGVSQGPVVDLTSIKYFGLLPAHTSESKYSFSMNKDVSLPSRSSYVISVVSLPFQGSILEYSW